MSRVLESCEGSTRIARELCRVLLAVSFGFQHLGIEGSGFTRYQVCVEVQMPRMPYSRQICSVYLY